MINLTNVKQDKSIGICSMSELSSEAPIVLALGMFDGVHMGHKELFKETVRLSEKYNASPTMMTFVNHPFEIVSPKNIPQLLTTSREKAMLAADCGIKQVLLVWFDDQFAELSPEDFISDYILRFNVKAVVCGFNYKFGYKAKGDADHLKKRLEKENIEVSVIDPLKIDDIAISSTNVRSLIEDGQMEEANALLSHPYIISGIVRHGFERGRELGFPTANIQTESNKCLPPDGVYVSKTYVGSKDYVSVTNIGTNPTFGNDMRTIETYIVDFKDDIYGEYITVEIHDRIREEAEFSGEGELREAILSDIEEATKYFLR